MKEKKLIIEQGINVIDSEAYTEEDWDGYYKLKEKGRIPNEHHDLICYAELAAQADNGAFEESRLEALKAYILEEIP